MFFRFLKKERKSCCNWQHLMLWRVFLNLNWQICEMSYGKYTLRNKNILHCMHFCKRCFVHNWKQTVASFRCVDFSNYWLFRRNGIKVKCLKTLCKSSLKMVSKYQIKSSNFSQILYIIPYSFYNTKTSFTA